MSTNILYRLCKCYFYYYDPIDDEYAEDITCMGCFTSRDKLQQAIETCKRNGLKEENIIIQSYEIKLSSRQKYVYVLTYGYATYNEETDVYTDYYYNMLIPQKSKKLCVELKKKLLKEEKFAMADYKIYDYEPDGFFVETYELNTLYSAWPR